MPFVQGHLRNESVAITIDTECAHCSRSIRLELESAPDRELGYRVVEGDQPLVFVPHVDFEKLKDPSIIDAF
jgi:hypothetical protein